MAVRFTSFIRSMRGLCALACIGFAAVAAPGQVSAQNAAVSAGMTPPPNLLAVKRIWFSDHVLRKTPDSPLSWAEEVNGVKAFSFTEEARDGYAIWLLDEARNMKLKVDLQSKEIFFSFAPFQEPWVKLANVSSFDTMVSAVSYAGGRLEIIESNSRTNVWGEKNARGDTIFKFVEDSRDATSITMTDAGRDIRLRVDLPGSRVYMSQNKAPEGVLFYLTGSSTVPAHVMKFAPELRFDRASVGYPISAQRFFRTLPWTDVNPRIHNTDKASLRNGDDGALVPTYFQVRKYGTQVRIRYWWFYGFQWACTAANANGDGTGSHDGDWENITVILSEDMSQVAAVVYGQHGGHYTRISGPRAAPCTPGGVGRCEGSYGFPKNGDRPVAYVGKVAHGMFHDSSLGVVGPGSCAYFADPRNPGSDADHWRTWETSRLINLDGDEEDWIKHDRIGNFRWGPEEYGKAGWNTKFDLTTGVSNHPSKNPPGRELQACTGLATYNAFGENGCFKSECLSGDDQASEDCLKECRRGYTNHGLTCFKHPFDFYGRLTDGNKYSYRYTLPLNDVGLTRRR